MTSSLRGVVKGRFDKLAVQYSFADGGQNMEFNGHSSTDISTLVILLGFEKRVRWGSYESFELPLTTV